MSDPRRPVGKLGCLPGQIPVGLHELSHYVAGSLPKPPSTVGVPAVSDWGMLANDVVGDCGVAGLEHGFMACASITGESEPQATGDQAKSYYFTYTGGQDSGVVLSQYLAYVRRTGYFGRSVDSFAHFAVHDVPTLQTVVWLYGFAYTGIAVTQSMQEAYAAHQPWTTQLLDEPVIGGHCIPIVAYSENYLYAITWGGVQQISYPAWHAISTEAWAVIPGELVAQSGDGRGVDLASLRADLDRLRA